MLGSFIAISLRIPVSFKMVSAAVASFTNCRNAKRVGRFCDEKCSNAQINFVVKCWTWASTQAANLSGNLLSGFESLETAHL
jgi:hypothetical protein